MEHQPTNAQRVHREKRKVVLYQLQILKNFSIRLKAKEMEMDLEKVYSKKNCLTNNLLLIKTKTILNFKMVV